MRGAGNDAHATFSDDVLIERPTKTGAKAPFFSHPIQPDRLLRSNVGLARAVVAHDGRPTAEGDRHVDVEQHHRALRILATLTISRIDSAIERDLRHGPQVDLLDFLGVRLDVGDRPLGEHSPGVLR